MLHGAEVAVCSQNITKHLNEVWQDVKSLNFKPVGASRDQQALEG